MKKFEGIKTVNVNNFYMITSCVFTEPYNRKLSIFWFKFNRIQHRFRVALGSVIRTSKYITNCGIYFWFLFLLISTSDALLRLFWHIKLKYFYFLIVFSLLFCCCTSLYLPITLISVPIFPFQILFIQKLWFLWHLVFTKWHSVRKFCRSVCLCFDSLGPSR